jgi:sterol desaturase/sphingolipid hydroxylase (fatty acid hydroxylase superfamily)
MKAHHMRHHFRDNLVEFGVTIDLWDYVFGTKPEASKYD